MTNYINAAAFPFPFPFPFASFVRPPEDVAAEIAAATAAAPFWQRAGITPAMIQRAAPQPAASAGFVRAGHPNSSCAIAAAQTDCKTSDAKKASRVDQLMNKQQPAASGFRSNNQHRLFLMRNAAKLQAIERRNADAAVQGPRFIVGEAPHRPQGPHPHIYQSLHEDPLPLLGPRSGVQIAYLERLRAIEATAGPGALLPRDMTQHVQTLVAAQSGVGGSNQAAAAASSGSR